MRAKGSSNRIHSGLQPISHSGQQGSNQKWVVWKVPYGSYRFLPVLLLVVFVGCGGGTSSEPQPQQKKPTFQLMLSVNGSGTVTSTPAGISCPSSCTASFASGTTVTLNSTASAGSTFVGFGGHAPALHARLCSQPISR